MVLVSIIIPCYAQAAFLPEAIDSVLAQTYPHYEIVVVDDGSPDDPLQVVKRYASVRYLRQNNRGVASARNSGIQASIGEYLVFLDADDRLLPNHLQTNLKAFQEHPDAGFVCGDYRWFGVEGNWHVHDCRPSPDHYATLLRRNFIGPPHVVMFKRQILQKVGGFREDLVSSEDPELYLRIARAYPIYCHHEVIAEYRRHGAQASQKFDVMLKTSLTVLRLQRDHIKQNPVYREAYNNGIPFRQRLYEGGLQEQIVRDIKTQRWHRATEALFVLLRYHPRGLASILWSKLRKIILGIASGSASARSD
ncbi:MAG TPA: glycosyltransferase [Nitrospira sp.]|nr:glycosyltransferase [Nitrospira sp.]